jgi:hypothetical protein
MKTTAISPEQLCARIAEMLDYDPKTGIFRWKCRTGTAVPGAVAGHLAADGYIYVRIDRKLHKAHRLAFLLSNGYLPPIIDHIDGDRANNALSNIRAATRSQNGANACVSRANKTGFKGVSVSGNRGYFASIRVERKTRALGYYETAAAAANAYAHAAKLYFGEFARLA